MIFKHIGLTQALSHIGAENILDGWLRIRVFLWATASVWGSSNFYCCCSYFQINSNGFLGAWLSAGFQLVCIDHIVPGNQEADVRNLTSHQPQSREGRAKTRELIQEASSTAAAWGWLTKNYPFPICSGLTSLVKSSLGEERVHLTHIPGLQSTLKEARQQLKQGTWSKNHEGMLLAG